MVEGFDDLDEMSEDEVAEMYTEKESIDKIFLDVANTPAGKLMFEYLRTRFVEVPMIHKGDTIAEAWERQGKADLIRMMERAIDDALHSSR